MSTAVSSMTDNDDFVGIAGEENEPPPSSTTVGEDRSCSVISSDVPGCRALKQTTSARKRGRGDYPWQYYREHDPEKDPKSSSKKVQCLKCRQWKSISHSVNLEKSEARTGNFYLLS